MNASSSHSIYSSGTYPHLLADISDAERRNILSCVSFPPSIQSVSFPPFIPYSKLSFSTYVSLINCCPDVPKALSIKLLLL